MKIATWNVNGVRARQGQLLDWLSTEKPDIVCLQEIKASLEQLPFELRDVEGYWSYWHGEKGYSGVALLVAKTLVNASPVCVHPEFDFEQRIACTTIASPIGEIMLASIYVPNGGKDYEAKLRFLDALDSFAAEAARNQRLVIFCGDLNVARTDRDIHERERRTRWAPAPMSAPCWSASSRGTSWMSAAPSIPTTTTCSRGGRRGGA